MNPPLIKYRGHRRDGVVGCGATITPASELAGELFAQGWRDAELTCDGRMVGQVGKAPDGVRTWWAES